MIRFFPPSTVADQQHWKDTIISATRMVSDGNTLSFQQRADSHWRALLHSRLSQNRSVRGQWLQICVYDALRSVGIDRVVYGKEATYPITGVPPISKAEVDMLVPPIDGGKYILLYCKVSFRERWAQADRAAMIVEQHRLRRNAHHILVTVNEHDRWTLEEIQNHLDGSRPSFYALNDVVSIRLSQFNEVLELIKKQ